MPSTQRDLLVLLRQVENRLCADCDAPLGESSVSGCILFGTWVCGKCYDVHSSLRVSQIKSVSDTWTKSEVNLMRMAGGNQRANKIYEKYIPTGWTKCRPNATYEDRELWIRAKYDCKVFTLPPKQRIQSQTKKAALASLPVRIVDFFLVVGPTHVQIQQHVKGLGDITPEGLSLEPCISSCYPAPNFYKDMLLPEHVSHFVFPTGLHLSSVEKTPYFFTFVLTDVNGIKMYGATLHVYELVEPEELSTMVGLPVGSPSFPKWPIVFAPKALTVLSHYAFYNLFREFLEQLYRISLSSSPIPLERYIVNFVHEVPLPPQGQIEVNFALADRTIRISRPPKNRLPMVDFSYRPLFTCLSVDNILLIFSALCTERKVCICSDNVALLTPVQEALLSLLFPLVWQGAYIPVVPSAIDDILDAPVPILVGLHSRILIVAEDVLRHPGVIYVDLDNGLVRLGEDDSGREAVPPPALPDRAEKKLRAKLNQCGGCIWKKSSYPPAGIAFPRREHLNPIRVFASEQGVIQRATSVKKSSQDKSADKSVLSSHPTASSRPSILSSSGTGSILDPCNNVGQDDAFNAVEIRGAFLRFFVSILKDYASPTGTGMDRSISSASSRHSYSSSSVYSNHRSSQFLAGMKETQMFERFSEERIDRPYQPEIKFFDEAILDKMNRQRTVTMLGGNRNSLPFLSDDSDEISEVYTPPPPSNWGIPVDHTSSYLKFPTLRADLYGPVRRARPLLRAVEVQRARKVISEEVLQMFRVRRVSFADSDARQEIEDYLQDARRRFHRVNIAITTVQSVSRMWRVRVAFIRYRRVAIQLQRKWRAIRLQRLNEQYNAREKALVCRIQAIVRGYLAKNFAKRKMRLLIRLQSFSRMSLCLLRAERGRKAALRIQTIYRSWCICRRYQAYKGAAVKIQARGRGVYVRVRSTAARVARITELRLQLFELWKLAHTPLLYRSQFWKLINGSGYLHVALHEDELRRLWHDLRLEHLYRDEVSFSEKFDIVNVHLRTVQIPPPKPSAQDSRAAALELAERKELYLFLKQRSSDEDRDRYYKAFRLGGKTKKRILANELLWGTSDFANASATVILAGVSESENIEWLQGIQGERVRKSALQTVQACLLCLQRLCTIPVVQFRPSVESPSWRGSNVMSSRTSSIPQLTHPVPRLSANHEP